MEGGAIVPFHHFTLLTV